MANFTYVTLVPFGGTPVHLADQTGAPFATTGSGALVFANGPVITNPIFSGPTNMPAGSAPMPSLTFGDITSGLYSSGAGSTNISASGVQRFAVTPTGISVTGNVTYSGSLVGAFASPLTTQGDLYYFNSGANARLPIGGNGTVLGSNGTSPTWVVAGAGTVSSVTAGTGLTGSPNPIVGVGTLSITNTAVTPNPYGSATQSPTFTVNAQGQLTAAANVTITPALGSITGLGTGVGTALGTNVGTAGSFVVEGGALGTPSSGTLTNATGLPISSGVSGLGAGIAAALAIATGSAGSFVTFNGAGGTPSSLTLTNATGLPAASILAGALASGMTGVTQAAGNNSTLLATTAFALLTAGSVKIQVFDIGGGSTQTYTPSAGMVNALGFTWGAGGGGGGTAGSGGSRQCGGGGGGAGSLSIKLMTAAQVGASKTVTLGTAGTAGASGNNAGGNGGDTSIGVLCVGKGGTGGAGQSASPSTVALGGLGGVQGTGDITSTGAPGASSIECGATSPLPASNFGGSSLLGGGGRAVNTAAATTGEAGTGRASGGSGGQSWNAGGTAGGGAGTAGHCFIIEFCNQ